MKNVLYRYKVDISYPASYDMNGEYTYNKHSIPDFNLRCEEYEILKETPKGYWIDYFPSKKFVLKSSPNTKRRFADSTKSEALNSFIKRKEKQQKILESQVYEVKISIRMAKELNLV